MKILGVNCRHYPTQASMIGHTAYSPDLDFSANPPPTVVVLVEGEIGDYAAYCGHGSEEWVARFGDKISFQEACCYFPGQLQEEKYRT